MKNKQRIKQSILTAKKRPNAKYRSVFDLVVNMNNRELSGLRVGNRKCSYRRLMSVGQFRGY